MKNFMLLILLIPFLGLTQGGVMITEIADPNDNASAQICRNL